MWGLKRCRLSFVFVCVSLLLGLSPQRGGTMATWSPRVIFYQLTDSSVLSSCFLAKFFTVSPGFHWASPERIPVADWSPFLKLGIAITHYYHLSNISGVGVGWGFPKENWVLVLKYGKEFWASKINRRSLCQTIGKQFRKAGVGVDTYYIKATKIVILNSGLKAINWKRCSLHTLSYNWILSV